MSKRFTDTDKWDRAWFRKLKPKFKCSWFYLLDRCDNAGIWFEDFEAMSFNIGEEITRTEFLEVFGDKVKQVKDDAYIVNSFVEFQYGELSENNNAHKSVISKLKKLAPNEPLMSPCSGAQDKEEDKDKEKDLDKVKDKEEEDFLIFWNSQTLLPKVLNLSKSRKQKLKLRIKEFGLEKLKEACSKISLSGFLLGKNDKGWKADFDWFVANDTNPTKILENKYQSSKSTNPVDHAKDQMARMGVFDE